MEEEGLYPDIDDENFLMKLLAKREFRESKQEKITDEMLEDDVCVVKEFEYTPVQRFIAQFMSPKTPYNGMLLYHGVGVGKTCTAVLTAEAFLELSPKNKVYILAPPAIQAGFYRTIFDINRLTLGKDDDDMNSHDGCTGNRYLELTQTYYDREKKDIELRVNRLINKRYAILGYVAFRNIIRDILNKIPSTLSKARQAELEITFLKRAFSGCLFIVDEAHNMRDVLESDADTDNADADESAADERSDASAGKKLAPQLRRVLRTCDGIKLLLMTATPMYNNYKEIIPLLNFLLHADHADESMLLTEDDIEFEMTEEGERLTAESEEKIIRVANGHVSFMRGENPRAFPARLDPPMDFRLKVWPDMTPNGSTAIEPQVQKTNALRLPLIECPLYKDSLTVIHALTSSLVAAKGVGIRTIDTLLQAGNCVFPGDGTEGRTGTEGFQSWFSANAVPGTFEGVRLSTLPQYTTVDPTSNITWMGAGRNSLGVCSPKINSIIQKIQKSEGVSFVYSRFVENGAVIFCLLLEANGYTPWGRSAPLFRRGLATTASGRQCSKCEKRESGHPPLDPARTQTKENHSFSPAYYALLTASSINTSGKDSLALSPNNNGVINAARDPKNLNGATIKVIVGSQVAGEGLDLKAIRDIHILEGWFHLSKEEQIVGRGIRYCSHNGLPKAKRNCTVNLYVNTFPADLNKETIDLYTYRTAMNKAVRIGNVSRAIKQGSSDCNLNKDAILVTGLQSVQMIDSMGIQRNQNLNDRDFTPICDWIRCSYECKPSVDFPTLEEDLSTYDIYAARFAEQNMISRLKAVFKEQPWYRWEDIQTMFPDIPETILLGLLTRVVDNKSIKFINGSLEGHIIYRNNLFLFQPNTIQDTHIPIAMRYGRYPIKRDFYEPKPLQLAAAAGRVQATTAAATLAGATAPGVSSQPTVKGPPPFTRPDMTLVKAFWIEANRWIDSWNYDKVPAVEGIPAPLTKAILEYLEGDNAKKDTIEIRLKKLQWWGRSIGAVEDGLQDLQTVGRQYIWDNFIKPKEQIGLLQEGVPYQDVAADEQIVVLESITAFRLLDLETKRVLYVCGDRFCADSLIQQFEKSKTDTIIATRANQRVSAEIYGFTVPWQGRDIMFKTNEPKPEGSAPAGGAACAIVSNVTGHRKKIVLLGEILNRYTGSRYDLTDEALTVTRKMTSAINYCALMEIVMRWMDVRKARYGGLKYFYRPLSSFYSGHKEKK